MTLSIYISILLISVTNVTAQSINSYYYVDTLSENKELLGVYVNHKWNNGNAIFEKDKSKVNTLVLKEITAKKSLPFNPEDYPNITTIVIEDAYYLPENISLIKKLNKVIISPVGEGFAQYQYNNQCRFLSNLTTCKNVTTYIDENLSGSNIPESFLYKSKVSSVQLVHSSSYLPLSLLINQTLNKIVLHRTDNFTYYLPELENLTHNGYVFFYDTTKKNLVLERHRQASKIRKGKYIHQYTSTGEILVEGKINNNNLPDGKWVFYYPNKKIAQTRYYENGKEDSIWTFLNDKGDTTYLYKFTDGLMDSSVSCHVPHKILNEIDRNIISLESYTLLREKNLYKNENLLYEQLVIKGDSVIKKTMLFDYDNDETGYIRVFETVSILPGMKQVSNTYKVFNNKGDLVYKN